MSSTNKKFVLVRKRLVQWVLMQCVLPFLVLASTMPISAIIIGKEHWFVITFADCAFLLYSATLVIGVSLELVRAEYSEKKVFFNLPLNMASQGMLVLGILFLLWYAVVKADLTSNNYFYLCPLPEKVMVYAFSNLVITLGSMCYGFYGLSRVTELITKRVQE